MTPRFSVRTVPHFDRLARRLDGQHPEFPQLLARAMGILAADPANVGRQHNITKLADVQPGDGQWRLRLGRFRFLYDIAGRDVELVHCALRREDTYRER